jgi:hypothetical protein
MEALLLQIEGIASCTHHPPEQLRLPLHAAKCSQSTVHYMLMKNMIELSMGPASARFCPPIGFIGKIQLINSPIHLANLVGNQHRTGCAVL